MSEDALVAIARPPGEPDVPPFSVAFERLHRVRRKPGHWVSGHVHGNAEVMLPTHGRYRALVAGSMVEAPSGGAVLIAPGDRHEDVCDRPVGFYSLSVRIEPGPAPGRSRPLLVADAPPSARAVGAAPEVHAVADRMFADGPAGDACAARVQDALATELLWRLLARLPRSALAPDLLPSVERADFATAFAAACARHLTARPTAAGLADELGIAERTLTARCRRVLGDAPLRLFRRHQMQHARVLLRSSGMGVGEVARQLGYANPFHFSSVYKRVHGAPPSHAGIGMPAAGTGMVQQPDRRRESPP